MKKIVGLKELRENMDTYASRVGRGESFVVVKKSKPIFSIHPVESEEFWETVIDFSKIRKGGVLLEDILKKTLMPMDTIETGEKYHKTSFVSFRPTIRSGGICVDIHYM